MKKNKIPYRLFSVLLMLLIIGSLTGCGASESNIATEIETVQSSTGASGLESLKFDPAKYATTEVETEATKSAETEVAKPTETKVAESATVETKATETVETETTNNIKDENTKEYDFNSVEAIAEICGLHAGVERGVRYCYVDTIEGANPYDVEWDYGAEYDEYVDACDWSLIFDADYYMDTFPMLAMQYHYDEDLLLVHFQTVGVHEGRQGSADFNVSAYASNCDSKLWNTFGENYEGYYIYYMLNYDIEKKIDTVNIKNGNPTKVQYAQVFTAAQLEERDDINEYRVDVDAQKVALDSELCAIANYRAYINAHDGYVDHAWVLANENIVYDWLKTLNADIFSENTVTREARNLHGGIYSSHYKISPPHYKAMVDTRFNFTGVSHTYVGDDSASEFDIYVPDLTTPMHD